MKWTIASLPAWHQAMLAEVAMARGLPGTLCYFADRSNGRLLSVLLVAGLAATAIGAEISSACSRESARVWPAAVGLGLTALRCSECIGRRGSSALLAQRAEAVPLANAQSAIDL